MEPVADGRRSDAAQGYVLVTAQDQPPVSAGGNVVACRLGAFSLEERVEFLEAVGPTAAMQL